MHLMQCKCCNHVYVGGPHRIRAHLLGIRGKGIEKCKNASDVVKSQFKNSMVHGNDQSILNLQINASGNSVAILM